MHGPRSHAEARRKQAANIFPKPFFFLMIYLCFYPVPRLLGFFGSAGWISQVERCRTPPRPKKASQRWLRVMAAKLCLRLPAQLRFPALLIFPHQPSPGSRGGLSPFAFPSWGGRLVPDSFLIFTELNQTSEF